MTGHDAHEACASYSPAQILKDGCAECSRRSLDVGGSIARLDALTFKRAWLRAADFGRDLQRNGDRYGSNELPVLKALCAVQVQLEARGIPIGVVPGIPVSVTRSLPVMPDGPRACHLCGAATGAHAPDLVLVGMAGGWECSNSADCLSRQKAAGGESS